MNDLERGRERYRRRAWTEAYQFLALADRTAPLQADDLDLLAMTAYLIGRDDDYLAALERGYQAWIAAGERLRASRCAFWLGLRLLFRGEVGRATGWLARAERLLEDADHDCAERGYLLLPVAEQHLAAANCPAADAAAAEALAIGERCQEADLVACARHLQGRIQLQQGRVGAGLVLLDETMIAVIAGELSPLMTGLMYCSVIEACQQVRALARAREWTSALARWCEGQPDMVAFSGVCRAHCAEIMQLRGAWQDAIEEAARAIERSKGNSQQATAAAYYQQAEVHRLRGEFTTAEQAYRVASLNGLEPQPGLALLRLAQDRIDAAVAAIHRSLSATTDRNQRIRLLPAHVEISLAVGDIQTAGEACRDLEEIARVVDTEVMSALAAYARGAVALAEGDAPAALGCLRRAWQVWQQVEAPYPAARARVLAGLACRALGDHEGAELELEAARVVFEQLGAAPDLARIDRMATDTPARTQNRLTTRELQVLRHIATGKTNKAIAVELFVSEKTIDRHVSNIFTKLDLPSRAAATAYAFKQGLV